MPLPQILPATDEALFTPYDVVLVRPGDTFVLTTERELSQADAAAIRAEVERRAPGVNVIVLTKGWRVGAIVRDQEGGDDAAADD